MTSFTITIDAPLIVAALDRLTAAILQCGGGGMDSRPTASGGPPTPIPAPIPESPSGAALPAAQVPAFLDVSSQPVPSGPTPAAPVVTNLGAAVFSVRVPRHRTEARREMLRHLWEVADAPILECVGRLNALPGELMTRQQVLYWKDALRLLRPVLRKAEK